MEGHLPAYPWSSRPDNFPLTADEVCAALAEERGIITRAALRLRVGTLVLRKFVERSARARAVIREMDNRRMDRAVDRLDEALEDEDNRRVDWAIRYVLNSKNARGLGWGSQDSGEDAANRPLVSIQLQPVEWGDGTRIGPREVAKQVAKPMIELHASSAGAASTPSKTGGDE